MERATVQVYEDRAAEWQARRSGERHADDAVRFREAVRRGGVRLDVGCGTGLYLARLGEPVVGLDAARAMLELARVQAPNAMLVQADLEHLPFRDRSVAGAWARASYLHVPRTRLPLALARLHWALAPGAPLQLYIRLGDGEGALGEDGDFPGRFLSEWRAGPLTDVLIGAGFDVEAIAEDRGERAEFLVASATRARSLPDTVAAGIRLLVCGLNPSGYAADRGVGYARPTNRFWPAARAAGLVQRDRDPLDALVTHGVGMTDLVKRATTGARELSVSEYRAGAERVERLVRWLRPDAVCFVGLAGWRAAVDRRAVAGVQPAAFGGRPVYVMPSTSGANARVRLPELAAHLRAAAALAGE